VRALGVRTMTFNIVNLVVGASIFILPATVAGVLGRAAILAYLVSAIAIGFVALCFAEAGSRVSASGGLYAYAAVAFGPFIGYLVGVLTWLAIVLGGAALANVLTGSIGILIPVTVEPLWQAALLVALYAGLTAVNVRGVKAGAGVVEVLTVLKVAPLLLLIVAGALVVDHTNLTWAQQPTVGAIADGSFLLIFAFSGTELAVTPGGEIRDPARTVPRAILGGLALVTVLYVAIQLVAQGVLGDRLAQETAAPLGALAEASLGHWGLVLVLVATILSIFGSLSGDMLASPRMLYALGRDGHLPAAFGRVHEVFRTPHVAIVVHAAAIVGLGLTGTVKQLIVLAVVAALLAYLACAVSVLIMRRRDVRTESPPFRLPGGPLVPALACIVVAALLSRASAREFVAVALALGAAALLYALRRASMWAKPSGRRDGRRELG
jgi:amino acid transporter